MRINIRVKGQEEIQKISGKIDDIKRIAHREIQDAGRETARFMRNYIQQNKKRPQAGEPTELENSIQHHKLPTGWGVGEISEMPEYWAAINWGSSHAVGSYVPPGQFTGYPEPNVGYNRQGRWQEGGPYSFKIRNPIPAMHYIERTANEVQKIIYRKLNVIEQFSRQMW